MSAKEDTDYQVHVLDPREYDPSWRIASHCGDVLHLAEQVESDYRRRGYRTRIVTVRAEPATLAAWQLEEATAGRR